MAITLIQHQLVNRNDLAPTVINLASAPQSGSFLVLIASLGNDDQITGISQSNTIWELLTEQSNSNIRNQIWIAKRTIISGSQITVTTNINNTGNYFIAEYSGIKNIRSVTPTSDIQNTTNSVGAGGGTVNAASITVPVNELYVAAFAGNNAKTITDNSAFVGNFYTDTS